MPIYEYQCSGCHHTFDVVQKMSDEPVKVCPQCSDAKAVKLVSAAGFQLKGTGWYATDFKNKGTTEKKATDTTSESTSEAKKSTESVVSPKPVTKDE